MTKEELVTKLMKEFEADGEPITKEEAEEMAEMEIKAKGISNYIQAEEKKPRKKREVKKDPVKITLIHLLEHWLRSKEDFSNITNVHIVNEQKEIAFRINGEDYSLSLIKHRPPKKGE